MGRMSHPESLSARISHLLAQPNSNTVAVRYALDNRKGPKDTDLAAGRIEAGTHQGRIGALVEVRCGTDFVARTDEFRALCRELLVKVLGLVVEVFWAK